MTIGKAQLLKLKILGIEKCLAALPPTEQSLACEIAQAHWDQVYGDDYTEVMAFAYWVPQTKSWHHSCFLGDRHLYPPGWTPWNAYLPPEFDIDDDTGQE